MKSQDEIIQESIEQGNHEVKDTDSMAYRIVFNSLKKEPAFSASDGFIDRVVYKIIRRKEARATRRDYIWLAIGLFVFLIATFVTISVTHFKFSYGAFKFLSNYGGLLLFGGALVIGLQWIEKRFLSNKTTSA